MRKLDISPGGVGVGCGEGLSLQGGVGHPHVTTLGKPTGLSHREHHYRLLYWLFC